MGAVGGGSGLDVRCLVKLKVNSGSGGRSSSSSVHELRGGAAGAIGTGFISGA